MIRHISLLLLSMLLVLTGCNLTQSEPPVTYVVITGEAPDSTQSAPIESENVSISQEFTQAPAVDITPTPYISPDVQLQIANRYLIDGRYENAVFTYQAILNDGDNVSENLRAEAAFGLGQAALREGLFSNALQAFTILIDGFPQDFRAHQAFFLRGDAYLGLSQWQSAITDFQQYLILRPGWIDSYVYERIGDAELALGLFDDALASYAQATSYNRGLVPTLTLREKVAQVYISAGRYDDAIAQYEAILADSQNSGYRAEIEYLIADAYFSLGQNDVGLARMQNVFNGYESSFYAFQAIDILSENNVVLNSYSEARVRYFAEDYGGAIEAFNRYTTEVALTQIPAELYLLLGRAYRAVGNSSAAQVAFQTLIEQFPTDPLFGEALLERGRTQFLLGEIEQAITIYSDVAGNYGYLDETASEALWRVGYLYGTNNNLVESRRVFLDLADRYPDTEQARSGLFIAASAAVNTGDIGGAQALYARLAQSATGTEQASAYLWVGRLALQQGDQTSALDAFNRALAIAPDSYFGARAEDILVGRYPFTPPIEYVFNFDEAQQITEAENWLRQTFGITEQSPLWPMPLDIENDPRIIRGRELWTMNQYDEAQDEFFDVLETYENDALTSYRLSLFFRGVGAYLPSMQGAANIITTARIGTTDAPSYIARLRYPVYYLDEVLRASNENDIDPLLLFSLIRHESLFNTYATAAAGEKGLTQVIPSTAEYIADVLDWPDYQHSDLFRPYAGIAFGGYFLGEQVARFDGNIYAALAGYNAGPGRAIDWLELSGGDPDLFMSTITIASTQLYIQRIYGYFNIYRELYGVGF